MQKLLLSFILAIALFIGVAMPRETANKASGTHLQAPIQQEALVFGDGAHKRWKEFAEANPDFQSSSNFR